MGLIKEFREFALKGNVLDLAVGVIIGAAFGGIVNSLIKDVIMPVVSIPGNVDFSNLYTPLTGKAKAGVDAVKAAANGATPALEKAREQGPILAWGNFLTVLLNFLILAFCIFMVIKLFNAARRRFEAAQPVPAPAGPTKEQVLLTEIRDLLARRGG
jgi:large conductance mechanosensitive channel